MEYTVNQKMIDVCKFVIAQGHARINAQSVIEIELHKQKYGKYPEIVDLWDMDKNIIKEAEKITNELFSKLYKEGF